MWTKENRTLYDRSNLRYPNDLTDAEWALIKPLIPPGKPGGNKQTVDMRQVVGGLMFILSTGCQWRAIPKDLAPRSTINRYFHRWQWDGTLDRIHHELYVKCRELAEREASPTVAIIDSQRVDRLLVPPACFAVEGTEGCQFGAARGPPRRQCS